MLIKAITFMRKILTLALLISFACSEETEIQCKHCIDMTISDALPIQFWLNDCPTYNEKESCGVHSFCWNQKFHCDDGIRLQVTNTEEGQELSLQLLDEAGDLVIGMPFTSNEVDIDVTDEIDLQFSTTNFTSGLGDWINNNGSDGGSYIAWTAASPGARANGSPAAQITKYLAIERGDGSGRGWPAGDYEIKINGSNNSGGTQAITPGIYGMNTTTSQTQITSVNSNNLPDGGAATDITITFTLAAYWEYLAIRFDRVGPPGGGFYMDVTLFTAEILSAPTSETFSEYNRTVFDLSFTPSELSPEICNQKVQFVIVDESTSPEEIIAHSDFVEFSTDLGCTELIKYRNQRNFAGIDYENLYTDTSPAEAEYFYLRIPAVFFHQQFPGESESIELSDSKFITLNGVMREQTHLETDYLPYYMHKKIQLILMHQYVEIASKRWTKQDAYEIAEGNKRYPLKMAKCWLTERNFVARNVV